MEQSSEFVHWVTEAPYDLDVATFEAAIIHAQNASQQAAKQTALQQVIDAYPGDLLPDFYDDWILIERERLAILYVTALTQLADLYEEERVYTAAITQTQRILKQEPLSEVAHQRLIRLHLLNEDRAAALRAYHICATTLREELGVDPGPAIDELYMRLLRLEDEPAPQKSKTQSVVIPLIGRHDEWRLLNERWQHVQQGRPQLVLIEGEAGIGKTRLAEELVDIVRRQGMVALQTRAYAAESAVPYAPLVGLLRSQPVQQRLSELEEPWLTELARLLPELLTEFPDLREPTLLTDAWQHRRFQEAMVRGCLAAGQPLLLHFDDLQWCDGETLTWLHSLLHFDSNARILVVGTIRSGEAESSHPVHQLKSEFIRSDQCLTIELNPLSLNEVTALTALVRKQEESALDGERLFVATEGNPLFVVELAQAANNEAATDAPNQPDTTDQHLPSKLQAIIASRLVRLSDSAQELIRVAAVVGRSFTYDVLAASSQQDEDQLVEALDELWQRRIIREQDVDSYDFSHDRIREVAYREISRTKRRLIHRRVAEALERIYADEIDEISGSLAEHFEQGGNTQKVIFYLRKAGERAKRQFANETAIDCITRELALISEKDIFRRLELLLAREQLFGMLGSNVAQEEDLRTLQKIVPLVSSNSTINKPSTSGSIDGCLQDGQRYAALTKTRWWKWYASKADFDQAIQFGQEAIRFAHSSEDRSVLAEVYRDLGWVYFFQGDMIRARHTFEETVSKARLAEELSIEAEATHWLGAIRMFTGAKFADAMDNFQKALSIYESLDDLRGQLDVNHKLGYALVAQGEDSYEQAEKHIITALALGRKLGSQVDIGAQLRNLGWTYIYQGQYGKARETLHKALDVLGDQHVTIANAAQIYLGINSVQSGNLANAQTQLEIALRCYKAADPTTAHRTVTLHWLSLLHSHLQEFETALAYAKQALDSAEPRNDSRHIAAAKTYMGHAYLGLSDLDKARKCYQEARQLHIGIEQFNRSMESYAGLGKIAWICEQYDEAMDTINAIYTYLHSHRLDYTEEAFQVYLICYRILSEINDPRGTEILRRAHKHLQTRSSSLDAETAILFWSIPSHQEIRQAIQLR